MDDPHALGTTTLTVKVKSEYWRPSAASSRAKLCRQSSVCVGGITTTNFSHHDASSCAPGLNGPYCESCVDTGAYLDTSLVACRPCLNVFAFFGVVLGVVVGCIMLIVLEFAVFAPDPHLVATSRLRLFCLQVAAAPSSVLKTVSACASHVSNHPCIVRLCNAAEAITLPVKLKLLLGFALITAQIGDVYQVLYPPDYQSLTHRIFSPLRLDLFGWISGLHLRCLGIDSLQAKLLVYSLLPLGLCVAASTIAWVRCHSLVPALGFVLSVAYLFYPSVSMARTDVIRSSAHPTQPAVQPSSLCRPVASLGFQTLGECDCFEQVDNEPPICFLPADYSVQCSGDHAPGDLLSLGVLAILIYGIGVPVLYLCLLFSCRNAIRSETKTPLSDALSFLHTSLHPWALFWPIVEALRTILLTGFLALVVPGHIFQLLCGLLVAFAFAILQVWCAPYRTASNNFLAMAIDVSLVLDFISSIGVQANAKYNGDIDGTLLSIALYAAAFVVFPITFLSLLLALDPQAYLKHEEDASDSVAEAPQPLMISSADNVSINVAAEQRELDAPLAADEITPHVGN
jgi:hypothetical protein